MKISIIFNYSKSKLTSIPEDDSFTSQSFHWQFVSILDIVHSQRILRLDKVIPQNTFGKFWYTEWIKSPVDWMPSLESIIGWNQDCKWSIVHDLGEIAFQEEMLEHFSARFHRGQKVY